MELSSYQNPICYDIESDMYELEVPKKLIFTSDNKFFEVVVSDIIREKTNNLFSCVTSAEEYDYECSNT